MIARIRTHDLKHINIFNVILSALDYLTYQQAIYINKENLRLSSSYRNKPHTSKCTGYARIF